MQQYNNLEDKLNSLSNSEYTTPPAFVWDKIETAIAPPKKKRRFIIWFFFGLTSIVLGYVATNFNAEKERKSSSVKQIIVEGGINKEDEIPAGKIKENESDLDRLKRSNNEILKLNLKSINKQSRPKKIESKDQIVKAEERIKDEKKVIAQESGIVVSTVVGLLNDQIFDKVGERKMDDSTIDLTKPVIKSSAKEGVAVPFIKTLSPSLVIQTKVFQPNDVVCPDFESKKQISFFVEANLVTGSQRKQFGEGGLSFLANERRKTENAFLGRGVSVLGGVHLNDNIYAATGLEWYRAVDRFSLKKEGLTRMIVDYDIETGEPIDTSFVTGSLNNEGLINYDMINVPLVIGFEKQAGQWNYGFELTGVFNLTFNVKGKIMGQFGEVRKIEDGSSVYKNKLGFGVKPSLVLGRNLRSGISLHTRMSYSNYLTEVNDVTYDLASKIQFFKVEFGLRKDF